MANSFGRRSPPASALRPPVEAGVPASRPAIADPRMQALQAAARERTTRSAADDEFAAYSARRQAAIGPWRTAAYGLVAAPPLAAYVLGVHGLWLAPISLAGLLGPRLLKRARLRWAAQVEAEARGAEPM